MKHLRILIFIFISITIAVIIFNWEKQNSSDFAIYNTLISISDEQPNVRLIQEKIKPLIDNIIQEETKNFDDFIFKIKPSHDITLYYLNDFLRGQEHIIENIIQTLNQQPLQNLTLSNHIDFYGIHHELAIAVQDSGILKKLHNDIKSLIHNADADFYKVHHEHLYNQQKSERYPYKPHITLGGIFSKNKSNWSDKENVLAEKIRQRIKDEIFPLVLMMINKNNILLGTKISLKKR